MAEPVLLRMPFSHFCRKAEWGLTQSGVAYRTLDVRLLRMKDQYRANPEGTVPVLRVDRTASASPRPMRTGEAEPPQAELLFGSHAVLRWAEANRAPGSSSLYPTGIKAQVEAWESWADTALGTAVRREAYRALHEKPSLAAGHDLPLWMRTPFARRFYLAVLKLLKARRFDLEDPKVVREAIGTIAGQLGRTGTGYLFGSAPTAADLATAALLEPLVPAAALRGYDQVVGWGHLVAFVDRVRPHRTTRVGGRRVRESDWQEFERLNALAKPVAMPALRCECGVPDWTKMEPAA